MQKSELRYGKAMTSCHILGFNIGYCTTLDLTICSSSFLWWALAAWIRICVTRSKYWINSLNLILLDADGDWTTLLSRLETFFMLLCEKQMLSELIKMGEI
jgi:hypothetical protein